jgi:hypothetical protein
MDFTSAFVSMQQGHKVTRTTWKCYWCILNGEIIMVTKDGKAVNLRESPDMMYTISNMLCDDWGVCDDRVVSMMPGESATKASKIDPKNIRSDAKVNKHEEQKKKPEYTYNIKKPDTNNDKDASKDETKSTSYSASKKNEYNAYCNAIVVDNEGKVHKITLDNIPELKQLVKDDDTLKRLINWLM